MGTTASSAAVTGKLPDHPHAGGENEIAVMELAFSQGIDRI